MHRLPLVTDLCATDSATCIACCRGRGMTERALQKQLRRQTAIFSKIPKRDFPDRLTLLRHELASRRGLDFFLAILFLLPGVGPLLRRHAHHRLCCAFLGYPEGDESRPGCLLHPSHWGGIDRRRESAFALIPGFGCGEPGYFCRSAYLFRALPQPRRDRFRSETRSHSSFAYSRAVEDAEDGWMRSPPGDHQ